MSEKEMNLAILNKLYEIAFAVWEKMAKVADYGSYTASEIANMLNKEFNFSNEQNEDEKVVAISIGVPSCLDIPPNNMRLDIAANEPFPTAVGDCLCGVGKVVHTLPLPPPRSKRMSELITYTNFNTS